MQDGTPSSAEGPEILLHLDGVCIETAARRAHRELTSRLLDDDEAPEAAADRHNLLTGFLQGADFPALRAASPVLRGETGAVVALVRDTDGRWRLGSPDGSPLP